MKRPTICLLLVTFVAEVPAFLHLPRGDSQEACVSAVARAHFILKPEDKGLSRDLLLVVTDESKELKRLIPQPFPYPTTSYTIDGESLLLLPRLESHVGAIIAALYDVSLLKNVLQHHKLRWTLNARLLILLKDSESGGVAAKKALQYAWKLGIPHVTVVTVGRNAEGEINTDIYGWHGSTEQSCQRTPPAIRLLLTCPLHSNINETLFEPQSFLQTPKKQQAVCILPVVVIQTQPSVILPQNASLGNISDHIDGVEVRLVRTIGEALSFRPHFYTPTDGLEWGRVFPNGSGNGLMGELTSGEAEIGIGAIMPLPERTEVSSMSRTHTQSYLSWAVPRRRSPPLWTSLVAPFSTQTWLALFGTLLVAVIGSCCIAKKYPAPSGALLFSWGTMLGSSLSRLPELTWQRILLGSWLIACLVLGAAYQGALFSVLTSPRHDCTPDTLQELIEAKIPLGGHPGFLQLIDGGENSVAVRRSYHPLQHVLPVLDEVARGERDVALVFNKDILLWFNAKHTTDGQTVHIAREDIATYPVASFLRKNSPLRSRYGTIVAWLSESGLVSKWYQDLAQPLATRTSGPSEGPRALSVSQLAAPFWCLGVGLALATAVFTLEVLLSVGYQILLKRKQPTSVLVHPHENQAV